MNNETQRNPILRTVAGSEPPPAQMAAPASTKAASQPSTRPPSTALTGPMAPAGPTAIQAPGGSGANPPSHSRIHRPSSSGGASNAGWAHYSDTGAPQQERQRTSGRGHVEPADAASGAAVTTSPRAKRRSSQGSSAAASVSSSRTTSTTITAVRQMASSHISDASTGGRPPPANSPLQQMRSPAYTRPSGDSSVARHPGRRSLAAPSESGSGGGGDGGIASDLIGLHDMLQRPRSRSSFDSVRSELATDRPLKPPRAPSPGGAASPAAAATVSATWQAELPGVTSRATLKRSSSSGLLLGSPTATHRGVSGGNSATQNGGEVLAAERSGLSGEGSVQRHLMLGRRESIAGSAASVPLVRLPHCSPRVSSSGNGSREPHLAVTPLLMPFSLESCEVGGGGGSSHPASPGQQQQHPQYFTPTLPHPHLHQQQQTPPHQNHPQQQRPPSPQQQLLHIPGGIACLPTREASISSLASGQLTPIGTGPLPAVVGGSEGTATQAAHRRVSESSSHVSYGPSGGCLTIAPPPPPCGLLTLHRRPSNDAMSTAVVVGSRRKQTTLPGGSSGSGGGGSGGSGGSDPPSPDGSTLVWALPPASTASSSRRVSASGSVVLYSSHRPSADGVLAAVRVSEAAGKLSPVAGSRVNTAAGSPITEATASVVGSRGFGILRSLELAPLSLPGDVEGGVRAVLARTAAANAAQIIAGGQPPELDFGYSRTMEQFRLHQQQQYQQQHQQYDQHPHKHLHKAHEQTQKELQQKQTTDREQQQQQSLPHPHPQFEPQSQRGQQQQQRSTSSPIAGHSLCDPSLTDQPAELGSDAATAGTRGRPHSPSLMVNSIAGPSSLSSAPLERFATGRGTAASAIAAKPPRADRSMHGVLRAGSTPAIPSKSAVAAASGSALTHGSPSNLTSVSNRILMFRRPSSKAITTDLDGDIIPLGSAGPGTRISGWMGGWSGGSGVGGGSSSVARTVAVGSEHVELDSDPMGFRAAEDVDIRIHCLTFNMGGVVPVAAALPESLFSGSYLPPDADAAHLYVFATQESGPLADWEAALASHLGRRYMRVAAESLMSIHIMLFAVRSMVPYITDVQTSSVATGVGNVLGNKGGVALTFSLLGARVLLVGAHFAAHDQNVERRNADFHRICAGLFAPPSTEGAAATATAATTGGGLPRSSHPTPEQLQDGGGGLVADGEVSVVSQGDVVAMTAAGCGAPGVTCGTEMGPTLGQGRRAPLGPTLSRFSRLGGVTFGALEEAVEEEGGTLVEPTEGSATSQGGGGGDGVGRIRSLSRALSSSSVGSVASNVSAFPTSHAPENVLRTRVPSFWGGMSFSSAQRHSSALLSHFDVVIWMGDLNYRIAGTPEVLKFAIDENMLEVLRANDQLQKQQRKGKVLQGFQEMPIAFAPTFKLLRGTDDYDLRRSPSWTDRVLYLVNADPLFADLRPLYYMSVPELRTSDHKPVIAGFEMSIRPQHAGDNRHARQRGCIIS